MNQKFFDIKKERQDAIINASLRTFSEDGYKRASTDVIVRRAGISKGLLFHYFISKKGLYSFIYDYSVRFMSLELTQSVKKEEKDFFELIRQIEYAKTRVMKNYPYMEKFLNGVKFEKHPDALAALREGEKENAMEQIYNGLYRQTDLTKFQDRIDIKKVIHILNWCSEGFMREAFESDPDMDDMNVEYAKYIKMLRDHLYRPEFIKKKDEE
jgi:TetR/AcrR family transcriptional regulator